jgi:hypothetical protein
MPDEPNASDHRAQASVCQTSAGTLGHPGMQMGFGRLVRVRDYGLVTGTGLSGRT